jgi:hypothetical protein
MENVLQQVAGRCLLVGNVIDPNSPSTYPNSPAILQKVAVCRALENNLARNSLMFQTLLLILL